MRPPSALPRHDALGRRSFLRAGIFGTSSLLTLPSLLRAEAAAGIGSSRKAVINIHLDGGPPQMDLIDPKPDAPSEIRGEFASIPTALPGVHVSELLPLLARNAGRYALIRSLVGADGKHDAFQTQSGFKEKELASIGGRPALGSVLGKLWGRPDEDAPVAVSLMQGRGLVRNSVRPGFLGVANSVYRPDITSIFPLAISSSMQSELLQRGGAAGDGLELTEGLSIQRLEDRVALLRDLDALRRDIDQSGSMAAMDRFTQMSLHMLTSGRMAAALDLSREDPRVIERYLPRVLSPPGGDTMESERGGLKFLLARRLVEAGVRCVSLSIGDFDTHTDNFSTLRYLGPLLDHALDALVTDLEERGMLQDVLIVVWGEFGRTPKINAKAGRDHWPAVGMALLAGGGLRTGQVLGSTDRWAAEAVSRPVHYQDVFATVYHHLGIDPATVRISDPTGRTHALVDQGEVIRELI
jgi:hypothetical protein